VLLTRRDAGKDRHAPLEETKGAGNGLHHCRVRPAAVGRTGLELILVNKRVACRGMLASNHVCEP
jgi:hypothetical protein